MSLGKVFKFFVAFLSITTLVTRNARGEPDKILYQMKASYTSDSHDLAKHIVSLRHGSKQTVFGINHLCSGTIISENVVLTNVHCVYDKSGKEHDKDQLTVVAGITHRLKESEFTQIVNVKKILPYPYSDQRILRGDIALVFLSEPLKEDGNNVQRIELTKTKPQPDEMCITGGWGAILPKGPISDELLYVNVTIFKRQDCSINYKLSSGIICGGIKDRSGMDTGEGDSGSPLVCNDQLAGITTYSIDQFLLSFYTDISFYHDWITENRAVCLENSLSWIILASLILIVVQPAAPT